MPRGLYAGLCHGFLVFFSDLDIKHFSATPAVHKSSVFTALPLREKLGGIWGFCPLFTLYALYENRHIKAVGRMLDNRRRR